MFAFVMVPLLAVLFIMGYYVDFTMLETPQSGTTVSILALPTLKAIQAASELTCAIGCPDGAIPITATIPITISGVYGSGSMSGIVVTWFLAEPVSSGQGLLRPSIELDASTKSVIGIYNATTGISTGVDVFSNNLTAPPSSFPVAAALGIPDGAVILTERRLP